MEIIRGFAPSSASTNNDFTNRKALHRSALTLTVIASQLYRAPNLRGVERCRNVTAA